MQTLSEGEAVPAAEKAAQKAAEKALRCSCGSGIGLNRSSCCSAAEADEHASSVGKVGRTGTFSLEVSLLLPAASPSGLLQVHTKI